MASDPGPARKIAAVCKTGASTCAQGASIVSLSVALAAIRAPTTTTSNAYARHTQFRERPVCICEDYLVGVTNAPKPRRQARHTFQVLGRWGTYMNTRPMNSVVDKSTKSTDSSPYMFTNWHAQSRSGVCQFIGSRSSFYRMPRELSLCPRWSPMTGLLHIRDLQRQRRSRRSLRCKTCKSFGRRGHKSSRTR